MFYLQPENNNNYKLYLKTNEPLYAFLETFLLLTLKLPMLMDGFEKELKRLRPGDPF